MGLVILETDQVLSALLKAKAFGGAPIGIAFDQPSRAWIGEVKSPTVNLFLFDIRENVHRRDVMYEEIRDEKGALVGRRPPPRRFDLHYTVTAWAPKPLVEHNLLGVVLRCFCAFDAAPRDLLPPALAELPYDVLISTGAGVKRAMFLNMAGEIKAGFEIAVTVPLPPLAQVLAPPPVQQPPRLDFKPAPGADPARTAAATETVQDAAATKESATEDSTPKGSTTANTDDEKGSTP